MNPFITLPEESLSEILSRTSPLDASRFAVISSLGQFLPSDYSQIVSRSVSPVVYATKKELYLSLCRSPIVLDGGKLSFFLDQRTGKKCFMLGARELEISWAAGDTPQYWEWTPHADSRFPEVAQLEFVWWLYIRGKIKTRLLSPKTCYAAFLVFKLAEWSHGLHVANAMIRFIDDESDKVAEERAHVVHLQRVDHIMGKIAVNRADGWMEVEMGNFYCDEGDGGEVEVRLFEISGWHKVGLIVEGLEFRPLY